MIEKKDEIRTTINNIKDSIACQVGNNNTLIFQINNLYVSDLSKIGLEDKLNLTNLKNNLPFIDIKTKIELMSMSSSYFPEYADFQSDKVLISEDKKKSSALKLQQVSDLRKHLNKKIDEIDVDSDALLQIKQLGITTFREFVIYPSSILDGKTNLSYVAIKRIKSKLPLKKIKAAKTTSVTKSSAAKKPATKPKAKTSTKTAAKKDSTSKKPAPKTAVKKPTPKIVAKKHTPKTTSKKPVSKATTKQTTLMDLASKSGQNKASSKTNKSSSTNSKGEEK